MTEEKKEICPFATDVQDHFACVRSMMGCSYADKPEVWKACSYVVRERKVAAFDKIRKIIDEL